VPATPVVAVVPPALQAPRALARGRVWKIQLAAVRSVAVAEDLIERFRDRYVDLVGNLSLGVERVDLGPRKGVYYRIQAGAFSDRASAAEVCEALSQRDVDCMVVSRN
jgi:cell division septation protein DedD